jgi:SAM-dependent methyltransferase
MRRPGLAAFRLARDSRRYRADRERAFYDKSQEDRTTLPYDHLDQYLKGSVGLGFFSGKTVLDIGCGEGVYSAWIADRGRAQQVLGVELTEHRIRREYEKASPSLKFVCADIFTYDLQGRTFDVVFMNLVLHHLRYELPAICRIVHRALRPGGVLLAFEPNVYSPLALIALAVSKGSDNEGFLSPHQLRIALAAADFRDVSTGYFWRDRWWARNPVLASCFWVTARRV